LQAAAKRKRNALQEATLLGMVPVGRALTSIDGQENGGIDIPADEEHPAKRRRSEVEKE